MAGMIATPESHVPQAGDSAEDGAREQQATGGEMVSPVRREYARLTLDDPARRRTLSDAERLAAARSEWRQR